MKIKNKKIYVAGHNGLVGSSVLRRLNFFGYKNIVTISKKELDLRNQRRVLNFFKREKFDYVINAAGEVGGIISNNIYKADYIYNNISMQSNIINSCYQTQVRSLIFLGSSCVYPKNCKQPIKEKYLLSGKLEKTNEPYAIAKIAGIKMCESYNFQYGTNYKCLMPCNLYGLNDNYNPESSHFFPALLKKIYIAREKKRQSVVIFGSGKPKRELMYVDDLADACIYLLNKKTKETIINIGSGIEKSILEYAKYILKKLNYNCQITFDRSIPDGVKRKIVDTTIVSKYGWKSKVSLDAGFDLLYKDFIKKNKNKF
jgi:GDP-L-fucose synthase